MSLGAKEGKSAELQLPGWKTVSGELGTQGTGYTKGDGKSCSHVSWK